MKAVRIAILTVSDTRNLDSDTSGGFLVTAAGEAGHDVVQRQLVRDDTDRIRQVLTAWCDDEAIDVILTTGGTGLTGRDVTADVVESLYQKAIPGFGELFRAISYKEIGTSTMQSRATGGLGRGFTLMFALPGSTGACRTAWNDILVHQLNSEHRPCNLVELMPRFRE